VIPHTHVLQGKTEGCPGCASIRPESQVHPSLVPSLPAGYVPTSFEPEPDEDDDPTTPAFVEAMPEGKHRIENGRAVCEGGIANRCHWYPDSACDHESWPCGHEYVFHEECWLMSWLQAVDLMDTAEDSALDERIGEDGVDWPNGDIAYEWHYDYVTWSYDRVDPVPEGEPVPAALPDGRRDSDVPLWD
jgi:hypothetical protein